MQNPALDAQIAQVRENEENCRRLGFHQTAQKWEDVRIRLIGLRGENYAGGSRRMAAPQQPQAEDGPSQDAIAGAVAESVRKYQASVRTGHFAL